MAKRPPKSPRLASIWAQDERGVIGDGRKMLWRVPEDFKHFRTETLGCPVIMGRHSFEALGEALPGRTNIVITTSQSFAPPGVLVTHSLKDALDEGVAVAEKTGADTVWVIGGGRVYEDSMALVDELVVTYLEFPEPPGCPHPADDPNLVFAPKIDAEIWKEDLARSDTQWRPQSGDAKWKVVTYVRR